MLPAQLIRIFSEDHLEKQLTAFTQIFFSFRTNKHPTRRLSTRNSLVQLIYTLRARKQLNIHYGMQKNLFTSKYELKLSLKFKEQFSI